MREGFGVFRWGRLSERGVSFRWGRFHSPGQIRRCGNDQLDVSRPSPRGWTRHDDTRVGAVGNRKPPEYGGPLGDGGRYWRNGAVHDLDIVNVGSQTGAAIKVSQCKECEIYNIGTYNLYRSVVVFAGFHINLHDFDFQQGHAQARNGVISGTEAFSTAIEIYGSDNNGGTGCTASDLGNCLTRGDIMNIYSGSVDAGGMNSTTEPTDCIYHHDFFGTVWVKNLNCNQTRIGYNVRCDNSQTLGACPAFIHLDRLENETNNVAGTDNNHGILGDNFAQLECFSCQLGGSQAGGAVVALSGSRFHAGQFQWYGGTVQNAKSACVVSYIDGVTWVGGYVLRCGNGGDSGSKWGIQFSTGAVNNYVSGTQFCHDGLGATTTDMRPVLMANTANYTAVDHINIHNCAGGSSNQSTVSGNVNTITNEMGP